MNFCTKLELTLCVYDHHQDDDDSREFFDCHEEEEKNKKELKKSVSCFLQDSILTLTNAISEKFPTTFGEVFRRECNRREDCAEKQTHTPNLLNWSKAPLFVFASHFLRIINFAS